MKRVSARELRQHMGAVLERVQRGERLILTHRGNPIAIITPIDRAAFDEILNREAAGAESLSWIKASEPAFDFWEDAEDMVWDRVELQPPD
jgi:prevent-host-death family protein